MNVVTDSLDVANALRPVLLKLSRQVRRELDELDVTAGQVSILAHIEREPEIGVRRLAELEGVSQPRMSKVVQELTLAGLVTGERGTDRRRVGLAVTDRGITVLRTVKESRTAWLAARLERLSPEEVELVDRAIGPLAKLLEGDE